MNDSYDMGSLAEWRVSSIPMARGAGSPATTRLAADVHVELDPRSFTVVCVQTFHPSAKPCSADIPAQLAPHMRRKALG